MAEVPEHLLERSRARRAALGLGGGDASAEGAPSTTPATPASADTPSPAAAAAAAAPPAPVPAIETGAAAPAVLRPRRRVPGFMVPVLAVLPFWALLYAGAFGDRTVEEELTPAQLGAQIYTAQGCSGCHGANGQGGVGPALGGVEKIFPNIEDHMAWIKGGSQSVGVGNPYGDPAAGRVAKGGMPSFATLSDEELEAVATYEREAFGD